MTDVTLKLLVTVQKERDQYVAVCPNFHVVSQGKTEKEALENIQEALELFLDDEYVQKEYGEEINKCKVVDFDPYKINVKIHDRPGLTNIIGS